MKKFFKEFKEFITRGNVLQLAIGVVVGGAFGKITTSLVNDIITPLIASLIGASGFSDLKWVIKPADEIAGTTEIAVKYGAFIQTILDFLIIAFCIFLAMRIIMKMSSGLKMLSSEMRERIERFSKKEARAARKIVRKYAKLEKKIVKNKALSVEEKQAQVEALKAERDAELEKLNPKTVVVTEEPVAKPVPTETEKLLTEIRDLLANKNADKE